MNGVMSTGPGRGGEGVNGRPDRDGDGADPNGRPGLSGAGKDAGGRPAGRGGDGEERS